MRPRREPYALQHRVDTDILFDTEGGQVQLLGPAAQLLRIVYRRGREANVRCVHHQIPLVLRVGASVIPQEGKVYGFLNPDGFKVGHTPNPLASLRLMEAEVVAFLAADTGGYPLALQQGQCQPSQGSVGQRVVEPVNVMDGEPNFVRGEPTRRSLARRSKARSTSIAEPNRSSSPRRKMRSSGRADSMKVRISSSRPGTVSPPASRKASPNAVYTTCDIAVGERLPRRPSGLGPNILDEVPVDNFANAPSNAGWKLRSRTA